MPEANSIQIQQFKIQYCKDRDKRLKINDNFAVEVESYEELLPGNSVRSYATGNREIKNGFVVFKVTDTIRDITYYPVFSETVGRQLVNAWGMKLPSKMTIFTNSRSSDGNIKCNNRTSGHAVSRKEENQRMLQLIRLARSMMILHVYEPGPMREPFKGIYDKLETHPRYDVFAPDIRCVNTAITNFLKGPTNKANDNFTNLGEYITYLQREYPHKPLKNFDFGVLRNKMNGHYPNEKIVF